MNIILDALVILILGFAIFIGMKRGFVKSIIHFFGGIASFAVAFIYACRLSEWLQERFVYGFLKSRVSDAISSIAGKSFSDVDISKMLADKQSDFMDFLSRYGISPDAASGQLEKTAGKAAAEINDGFSDFVASGLAHTVSYIIAFVLILIAASIVIRLLIFISDIIFKLPVLHASNKLLGIVFGALIGLLSVFIFVSVVNLIAPYLQTSQNSFINGIDPDKTSVFRLFSSLNPLKFLFDQFIQ